MHFLDKKLKDRIEEKLKKLNSLRPLPVSAVKKLQEQFKIEMTYNSNAIEGNTLTLKETFLVINEGVTVKGKPLKDHLEAKDHFEALDYLYELIETDKKATISERTIRNLHQIITKDTDKEWAGRYRTGEVIITGATHKPPVAIDIPHEINGLLAWMRQQGRMISIVELAALTHHKLVWIHPFFDGNGRTARLLMNVVLMQKGYPLVVILKNDRKKYYSVLEKADKGDYGPLVLFIAQAVERSLDIYLKTVGGQARKDARYMSLAEMSSQTPYSGKYLNLLARQGKIEAHKQGRDWLTTKDAVEKYMESRQRKH